MCGLSAIFNLRKQRQDDVDNRSKSQGGLDHMTVKLDRMPYLIIMAIWLRQAKANDTDRQR